MRWLCLCLPLLCFATDLRAGDKDKPIAPQIAPGGGVLDPAGKIGYFPNNADGIDALDLATGKLLWSSKDANKPLLVAADRLFAMVSVKGDSRKVRVVALDVKQDGKKIVETDIIQLPGWATTGTDYGRSFQATTYLADETLLFVWNARAWYAGGARPTKQIEQAARKNAEGVEAFDAKTGKTAMLKDDKLTAQVANKIPGETRTLARDGRTLTLQDSDVKGGRPFQKQRILQAVDGSGAVLWRHEIKAPIFLPPRP